MRQHWTSKLLPAVGPILLFLFWQLAVSAKWLNPILLPSPVDTLSYMFQSFADASMRTDIGATLYRTLAAFGFAALIGVPLGVILGSNEKIYRSLEFLIDFFRSTPSSALIPLFLLIFGITDANKIAISAFAAVLVILFNSAYGVMNAKKTRLMAAQVMGISRWHIFKDIMLLESLAQTFCRPAHRRVDGAGDRDCRGDVYWFGNGARASHHRCAAGVQYSGYVRLYPDYGRTGISA